eukprot:365291_1
MSHTKVTKQGYLDKRSKHLKHFRSRWVVLKDSCVFSYTNEAADKYGSKATEIIDLKLFNQIKQSVKGKNYKFELISKTETRIFKAKSENDMKDWIKKIKIETNNFMYSRLINMGFDAKYSLQAVNKYPKALNKCIDLSVLDLTNVYQNHQNNEKNDNKTPENIAKNHKETHDNNRQNDHKTVQNDVQKSENISQNNMEEKSENINISQYVIETHENNEENNTETVLKSDEIKMDEYESKLYEKDEEIRRLNDKIEELLNELEYTKGINNEIYINRSPQSRKYSGCSSIPYSVLDHLDDISVISDVYDVYDVDHVYQTDNELCHKGVNTEISHL